ncbi:MAG TPA: hypothetical protein VIT91_12355 [Chthoniobacterales bacterium]
MNGGRPVPGESASRGTASASVPAFIALFWLLAIFSQAKPVWQVGVDPKSGIEIEVTSPFDGQPMGGYSPFRVRVRNGSHADREWTLLAKSPGEWRSFDSTQTLASRYRMRVEAGGERVFDILVPTACLTRNYSSSAISVQFTGFGALPGFEWISGIDFSGKRLIGNIGLSRKVNDAFGSQLRKRLDDNGANNGLSEIDFAELPPDWRALLGFDQIWMEQDEYDALPAAQRQAIQQWATTGGLLVLCRPQGEEKMEPSGFGTVQTFPLYGYTLAVAAAHMEKVGAGNRAGLKESYRTVWPDKSWMAPYKANAPLLIGVICIFGVVVGPINFFLLCGREKRHRIFFMTPLISIIGALLIGLAIFIQDGLGGWGRRVALILLQPGQNFEVVQQEQASRTGVLLKTRFDVDEHAAFQPMPLSSRNKSYAFDGKKVTGDWFQSRAVQGQILTAVRPSRARVELLNAAEVAAGQRPRVLSSIGAKLDALFYVDPDGTLFRAENVSPGRAVTLEKCDRATFQTALNRGEFELTGPRLRRLAGFPNVTPGWFYATAEAPKGVMIDTLRSLDWRKDRAFYLGPVITP